jgi:hypothetical protein
MFSQGAGPSRRRQPQAPLRRRGLPKKGVLSYWSCEQFNCEFRKITMLIWAPMTKRAAALQRAECAG